MTSQERVIVTVTFVAHLLCHASVLLVTGLLIPLREEFDLTEFWVTVLPLTGYVLMGVGAVPAGLAADRWGTRPVLGIHFLLTGLACGAAAIAPNAWVFAGALTILGAAVSLYHPTGLAMISHGVKKRGLALGIHGIAGSLGLAGSSFGLFFASTGNWRNAYWIISAVAIVCAAVFWTLPIRTDHETTTTTKPSSPQQRSGQSLIKLLVLLYMAMALSGFNYRSLMTALPTYLTASSSGVYTGVGSGGIVFVVFLLGGLGQFLSGRFADRTRPERLYVLLVVCSVPLAMLLAFSAGVGRFGAASAMALALFHFGTQPAENLLIAQYTPARLRGTSYGIKFLVTFGLGALGAAVVGFFWRQSGTLAWTFVLFAAVAVVVAGVVFMLARSLAQHARSSAPSPVPNCP
ncbi:MAG: MFS transporter [Phycisphaerales bacterium]|nr:MAG: MFS transporter [Phycisphaerales bacterium]